VQSKEPSSWLARRREKSHEGGAAATWRRDRFRFSLFSFFFFFLLSKLPPSPFSFFLPPPLVCVEGNYLWAKCCLGLKIGPSTFFCKILIFLNFFVFF